MHPRTEVIQSGKVRNLDVTESLTYQGTAFVPSAATDEKAKVSSNDTTPGYLNGKLVAGTNVTLTENNNGGDETLTISAAGGVTGFTATQNTASPNNVINVSQLLVSASSTNADMVLSAKGTGSIIAQIPNNTTANGNKRGTNAVDFQKQRYQADEVAGADTSAIVNGYGNIISSAGTYGFIGSGLQCQVTAAYGVVAGGQGCKSNASYAFVGGGNGNQVSGSYGVVVGGQTCSIGNGTHNTVVGGQFSGINNSCSYGFVGGGNSNKIGQNAAGNQAVVVGGQNNQVNANFNFVGGGLSNLINSAAIHGIICGGSSNTIAASQQYCFIGGGQLNTASGDTSIVLGGQSNVASSTHAVVLGGFQNTASGVYAVVLGGTTNTASHNQSIAMGAHAVANQSGMRAWASGRYAANGDCQLQEYILRTITTDATATAMSTTGDAPGETNAVIVASDTTIAFDILLTARRADADNESAAWRITGCIDNNAGTTALVGVPVVGTLADDSAGAWTVSITANNSSDRLEVTVTGQTGKTIRWAGHVRAMRITG